MGDKKIFDAIIIGSGINSLVAAAVLSKSGWRILVCERNDRAGGAIRTEQATLPGFTHELLSSWHPLFVGGAAYALLKADLDKKGLIYNNTESPTGVICKEGSAILFTNPEKTLAEFSKLSDSDSWTKMLAEFMPKIDLAFGLLGADLWRTSSLKLARAARKRFGNRGLVATGAELLEPAQPWLDRQFTSPVSKALLAPWALHNGMGPDDAGSAFITKVISAAIALGGMPVPVGGGIKLVEALVSIISDHGGEVLTNAEVSRVLVKKNKAYGVKLSDGKIFECNRAVLASTTPQFLYQELLSEVQINNEIKTAADNFRFGRAAIQIHLALSEPPVWVNDPRMKDVAIVHVLDGVSSLSESVNASNRGFLPARPTIVVGQPCAVDPSRAPEGKSIIWIQLQENPRVIFGDLAKQINIGTGDWNSTVLNAYTDRVIDQLSEQIPNLKSATLAKVVLGPREIEAMNQNLVGGDPYAGDCRIDQFAAWRPLVTATGHRTPVKNLWHIGASTHPGPGLGGGSGLLVAQRLLKKGLFARVFSR